MSDMTSCIDLVPNIPANMTFTVKRSTKMHSLRLAARIAIQPGFFIKLACGCDAWSKKMSQEATNK